MRPRSSSSVFADLATCVCTELWRLRTKPVEEAGLELMRRGYTLSEMMLYRFDDLDVLKCRDVIVVSVKVMYGLSTAGVSVVGPVLDHLPPRPLWLQQSIGDQ